MKKKHISIVLILFLFTLMSMTAGLWLAHTRFIDNGILALSDYLKSNAFQLEHSPVIFSKTGAMNLNANIKKLSISYKSGGISLIEYIVEDITLDSNLWNGEMKIKIAGDISLKSKFNNKEDVSLLRFITPPTIKINFKDPLTRTWASKNLIQKVEMDSIGYDVLDGLDANTKKISSVESIAMLLQKVNMDEELSPWHLKAGILNQKYFAYEDDQEVDKLMVETGRNDSYIDCIISPAAQGSDHDMNGSVYLNEFKVSSDLFETKATGDISRFSVESIPYLDVTITIRNIESMVSYYSKVFDAVSRANPLFYNSSNELEKKERIDGMVKIIKDLSTSKGSDLTTLQIKIDEKDFLISNVHIGEIFKNVNSLLSKVKVDKSAKKHKK